VRMSGVLAGIRTEHLPNTSHLVRFLDYNTMFPCMQSPTFRRNFLPLSSRFITKYKTTRYNKPEDHNLRSRHITFIVRPYYKIYYYKGSGLNSDRYHSVENKNNEDISHCIDTRIPADGCEAKCRTVAFHERQTIGKSLSVLIRISFISWQTYTL
jgi:hypothetical protein